MLTEQITNINDIPAERIRAVIERADAAFWRTIGQGFPEVTAGDFGPDDVIAWESARNRAVCSWLQYNAPRHGPDKHRHLTPADMAWHVTEDHGEDLADIDTQVDPAPYLIEHGIPPTGNHGLDVLLMWHEKDHPEQSNPAPHASPGRTRQATRLLIVVDTDQPFADHVVIGHAQQLAEALDHDGGVAFCVTVIDAQDAELTGWVARREQVRLSAEDLALLRQGDTIEVPYAGGVGQATLSGEEDFTYEQLQHLAAGRELIISTGRGALRVVTADSINKLDLGPLYPPVPDRPEPRAIGELLAHVAAKLGMEVTEPVGGVYHAHLLAAHILDHILPEQNRYEGDEVEIAQRLLEALDQPLAGSEDPTEHAMERLAHVLAFDGPDWHLHSIRIVDALWLASLGGRPDWQQRRETP